MDIFSGITLLGGLAFFLYGMQVLSSGLERMAGGKLEAGLKKLTGSRLSSLLLGAGITAVIQSSSAVTVMLVGLVNSGILTIDRCVGVIMGSNIGTTMTAWILTLAGIESDSVFISLLKPENFSLVFAFVGVLLIMGSKNPKRRDLGSILVGFAVLMYGMKLMSGAVKPLADEPAFISLFTAFRNPLLGVLMGTVVTAVIQSSSASVGILQALALTGGVSWRAAIPIVMGQNIGTCVTALLSCVGAGKNARKVAAIHVSFNIIGTAVCLALYWGADLLFAPAFLDTSIDAVGIAVVHTAFNVFTTALLFPFAGKLEALANFLLPDREPAPQPLLDQRLLATPSVAIGECAEMTRKMCDTAVQAVEKALSCLDGYQPALEEDVSGMEASLDRYEDSLGTFLVLLSSKRLSQEDSLEVSKMLHAIGDFERLGDHAVNLLKAARELHEKKLSFSPAAKEELATLEAAIREILETTGRVFREDDVSGAMTVEPLEQTVDALVAGIRSRHIRRLQEGECSIALGFVLSDVLNNLERVSDHCSNIAVAVIELSHSSFDTHRYLSGIRSENEAFRDAFARFSRKYRLP